MMCIDNDVHVGRRGGGDKLSNWNEVSGLSNLSLWIHSTVIRDKSTHKNVKIMCLKNLALYVKSSGIPGLTDVAKGEKKCESLLEFIISYCSYFVYPWVMCSLIEQQWEQHQRTREREWTATDTVDKRSAALHSVGIATLLTLGPQCSTFS